MPDPQPALPRAGLVWSGHRADSPAEWRYSVSNVLIGRRWLATAHKPKFLIETLHCDTEAQARAWCEWHAAQQASAGTGSSGREDGAS